MNVLQFTLKNNTSSFSAYNNYYCHDTGRSFEPIFTKFTWLVRVHIWANLMFFGNNWSNRTTDIRKNVPPELVLWLSFSQYGVFGGKNFKAVFGIPFPTEKVIYIFVVRHPRLWKMVVPPKNYFSRLFWKILFFFFWKNCYLKNI